MGAICSEGSECQAPSYMCNAYGSESWSSVTESNVTRQHILAIIAFCKREARRQGWNDCLYDRIDYEGKNIFHPKFLYGVPYYSFRKNYVIGVCQYADENDKLIEKLDMSSELAIAESAVSQLNDKYNISQLRMGVLSI